MPQVDSRLNAVVDQEGEVPVSAHILLARDGVSYEASGEGSEAPAFSCTLM